MAAKTAVLSKPMPALTLTATEQAVTRRRLPAWTKFVCGGALAVGLVAGGIYFLTRPATISQASKLQLILKELSENHTDEARQGALALQRAHYVDPEFPGGVEFVLGMVNFHEAVQQDESTREKTYVVAASCLAEAEKQGIPESWQPQWAWALGISLYRAGSVSESVPLLQKALEYPPGKLEAAMYLIAAWLEAHDPQSTRQAVELGTQLVSDPELSPEHRDQVWLQHAQALIMFGKRADAEAAMKNVAPSALADLGKAVLRAQVFMADERFTEALKLLEPVAASDSDNRMYPAQAAYLRGLCAQLLSRQIAKSMTIADPPLRQSDAKGWLENAAAYYEKAAETFESTQEALASQLGAADALRELDRREEALLAYGAVLRAIRKPEAFRNRWVGIKRVEERIMAAWESWSAEKRFAEAIALAEMMPPVIPRGHAADLVAQGQERWAEQKQSEYDRLPTSARAARRPELLERWKRCGEAYARAADLRSSGYDDAVATSALALIKGHDFAGAVAQWTKIVESQPPQWISTALLNRGQAYLDLDQPQEAVKDFQRLIAEFPTDANTYQAHYFLGRGFVEQNLPDEAEAAWRNLLTANIVDPTAEEWRLSAFALSRLLLHRSEADLRATRGQPLTAAGVSERREQAFRRLDEVLQQLDEYLRRYPRSEESVEARLWLGRAFQLSAERPADKFTTAETDHARAEYQKQRKALLSLAVLQFQPLQSALVEAQRGAELNSVEQTLLRTCSFELAHCRYALGEYRPAIEAYQFCVGRYQQDAEALLALVQMANCYQRLKQPAEAASTLTQAQLMLKQLPVTAFPEKPGGLSRNEWDRWLAWAIQNQ